MNNLNNSFKKFLGNKNTVTILGVCLSIVILYVGYNTRINQKVHLTRVPYAKETIQPRTEITAAMVDSMNVPAAFLVGSYYKNANDVIGKYSNYNTVIAKGSIFYTDLVVESSALPDSALRGVGKDETVVNYKVNMDTTYANSMMPGDKIKIYFKAKNDDGTIMFGKFLDQIKILAVKDSDGKHVFEDNTESRIPAYMLFALPEDMHLLFRKALYLSNSYGVELILVPNTKNLSDKDAVIVSSKDIQDFINDKTEMVSVDEILSSTEKDVTDDSNNKTDNNKDNNKTDNNKKNN